ncbi:SDR family oxidoreductase [Enterobacter sp. J706]|uniref:SDR family oxidoreductase n=1 Tax=Enterobacter sp. J706 TaxID=3444321 RepID=UPI003EB79C87
MTTKIILITGAGSGFGKLTAQTLAQAGHTVYASMRDIQGKNAETALTLREQAQAQGWKVFPLELDILNEMSCQHAIDRIVAEQGRLDVVINNAGALAIGVTEAFTPEQALNLFSTNTVGWLRVNRAVLPQMRRQGDGLVVYVGSVTSRILSPFQGPYIASKAAGDVLAETMHYENTPYGIDSVIIQPGAYTSGTHHFSGAQMAEDRTVTAQYDRINGLLPELAAKLETLNQPGVRTDASEVAECIRDVIEMPKGMRPLRLVVDPQHHGAEEINMVAENMQTHFMQRFGIDYLQKVQQG